MWVLKKIVLWKWCPAWEWIPDGLKTIDLFVARRASLASYQEPERWPELAFKLVLPRLHFFQDKTLRLNMGDPYQSACTLPQISGNTNMFSFTLVSIFTISQRRLLLFLRMSKEYSWKKRSICSMICMNQLWFWHTLCLQEPRLRKRLMKQWIGTFSSKNSRNGIAMCVYLRYSVTAVVCDRSVGAIIGGGIFRETSVATDIVCGLAIVKF